MIFIEASSENPCSLYSSVCYSPQAEKVYKLCSPPADLHKVGTVVTPDNDIYIAGGQVPLKTQKQITVNKQTSDCLRTCELLYWSLMHSKIPGFPKTPMLFVRVKPSLVCCEGYIYAIGGDSVGGELNRRTVERYDTEKDEWTMVSPLPCAWQWSAAVVVHDCIYVMTLNLMYCYFPRSDSW